MSSAFQVRLGIGELGLTTALWYVALRDAGRLTAAESDDRGPTPRPR